MIVASIFAPRYEQWPGCDYLACARLLDASCRRIGLRHVMISDREWPDLETAVFDLPDNLMMLLIDGQRQFLAATSGPVLLVGVDCLLTRDPMPFVAGQVTITTSATFSDCPMNTGMIWCCDGPTCAPAWESALALKPQGWGDDQRALFAALKASDLDVWTVEAEAHNWAPTTAHDNAGMPTVAHFRGQRKGFMAEWASRFLANGEHQ